MSTSDVTDLVWDQKREVYAIYAKTWLDGPRGTMHWKRAVVRTESTDFIHWTQPRLVLAADEMDGRGGEHELARTAGGGGSEGVQFHSAPAFCYNDMYFAMVQVMDSGNTGNMPIELALSHDGYDWRRPFRSTFFLPALEDKTQFDASLLWSNGTPILLQDEFRFYYGAYGHAWNSADPKQISRLGVATMPRDRFAGVKPIEESGQITFKPMELKACKEITLNANATGGSIRAEVLNANGYRLRGYSKDDAIAIKGDALRHKVLWNDRDLSELPVGNYQLRLHLQNAEVFALTVKRRAVPIKAHEVNLFETESGVRYGLWAKDVFAPAPTLFIFAGTIEQSLGDPYYRQCGNALAEQGYLCVSLDLPCHGQEQRPGEPEGLQGWRHRLDRGEEGLMAEMNHRISEVLNHLIASGSTDPQRVAVCGTSRGGFVALHFAASDARVKATAVFAPVTDLAVLKEFQGIDQQPGVRALALTALADRLVGRHIWMTIGDRDERVGTGSATAFASRIWEASRTENLTSGLELHVLPESRGHTTPAGASEEAAAWLIKLK